MAGNPQNNDFFQCIDDALYDISAREVNLSKVNFCEYFRRDGSCPYASCSFSHHPSIYFSDRWGKHSRLWNTRRDYQAWLLKYGRLQSAASKQEIESQLDTIPWKGSMRYCVDVYRNRRDLLSNEFDWASRISDEEYNIE